MLSNSCRYGIRAVIYLASKDGRNNKIGIRQISEDLKLPTPYLAKILQNLVRHRILSSTKGPNGGFSLLKKPESITLLDIVRIIDGEELLTNCIIHNGSCNSVKKSMKPCPVHDDFTRIRTDLINMFKGKTIAEIVKKASYSEKIAI
ncbi:MAG TPA: Rrf2 family transcriptional regulator [Bacteroidales bacterium]|jgi:Rrf2 family protein|nr:Rrf2 family transcriptional regulator [Bacteroidales bacterium]HNR41290.1 Rrf2 family transcriptional regulator [Bacteroidales bacterium]HPM87476.1 Rrf2 family transcriptional regulator [Bacteroidales bacterium]HQG76015.1 Rrf2 family transcriptional regulator [Bacteroidales bacterium]